MIFEGMCAEPYQYILREESIHLNFGIDVSNQSRSRTRRCGVPDSRPRSALAKARELEVAYGRATLPTGMLGENADQCERYMHFITNRRCGPIGLALLYPDTEIPFPWMSEMMDLKKEKDFFETRVIEDQGDRRPG